MSRDWVCPKCGGDIDGDGYTEVYHCENAEYDDYYDHEPDANVVYCRFTE
jgi:ribosomal protein L37AE/L43A